jgi:hypothetical protein
MQKGKKEKKKRERNDQILVSHFVLIQDTVK